MTPSALLAKRDEGLAAPTPFSAGGLARRSHGAKAGGKVPLMLWTLFVILLVLWLVGVVSAYTLGGFIHLLLILAVIALIVQLVQGRRVV